jgi:hypothetical protein
MINQLFVRMAGFFVCSGGTAACGEDGGCNTAMQKKRRATPEARPAEKERWL